jgi:hypothetical protein
MPLTITNVLDAWDRGFNQHPTQRALTMLGLAYPDQAEAQLATIPIGDRDAILLELREALFGSSMVAHVTCPACSRELELSFSARDIRVEAPPSTLSLSMSVDDHEVEFRLPNSGDLCAIANAASLARLQLFERCLLSATCKGVRVSADAVSPEVISAVSDRMAEIDPQADVQLALACPDCGHAWQSPLDIVSYLWTEIHSWATRMLREIHLLASTYGWRESDILALSPARRRAYLEIIGQ